MKFNGVIPFYQNALALEDIQNGSIGVLTAEGISLIKNYEDCKNNLVLIDNVPIFHGIDKSLDYNYTVKQGTFCRYIAIDIIPKNVWGG